MKTFNSQKQRARALSFLTIKPVMVSKLKEKARMLSGEI